MYPPRNVEKDFYYYGIRLVVFLTLLPYLSLLEQVRDWAILNKMPVTTGTMTDADMGDVWEIARMFWLLSVPALRP